tara:strand:+ start:25 stop:1188 length:1164 start_codon:yes stop_codon:yes gene_type:complete
MGSLLNFIFEKTWGQGNGPKGCCSKGPISNEIILKHNHSRTEYFEYKEGYKNLIVFEFTSIDRFIIEYKYRDKLLELKNKGCKIVFGFLSDPSYDESIENAKHWWEELDPIIIGGTPTSKFGYQFDYFIESTIVALSNAFGHKNELGYVSEKLKQNQIEFFRSNYFLCFNRQLEGKYARLRLFYDFFEHKLHENSCFSFLNKFYFEQIDTKNNELYKDLWHEQTMRDYITHLPMQLDTYDLPKERLNSFMIGDTYRKDLYQNSNIHIVTETTFENNVIFISEKVLRPIAMYQPFFVLGPKGYLKQLRSHGFQTFSEFWDESYDEIDDPKLRYEKVLEEILKIKKMDILDVNDLYSKTKKVLVHNHNLLSKLPTDSLDKYFEKIENEW